MTFLYWIIYAGIALLLYRLISPHLKSSVGSHRPPPREQEALKSEKNSAGLVIEVLKKGTGKKEAQDRGKVTVHYKGWLENGELIDSSHNRGEPYSFKLTSAEVIAGWVQGIRGMRVGEIRRLKIPPKLAYRDEGKGRVPPGATLTFEIELIQIGS